MNIGWIVLALLVPVALAVVLVVALRRAPGADALGMSPLDRVGVAVATALAAATAMGAVTSIAVAAAGAFRGGPLEVTGMVPGGEGRRFATTELVHVVSAATERVTVVVDDAPAHIRWLLFGEALTGPVAVLALSLVALRLSVGLLRRRPFTRAIGPALATSAVVLVVASGANVLLGAFARAETARFVDPGAGSFVVLSAQVDFTPWGVALFLGLIATAFQVATRMQKDTEGLV